MYVCIMIQYAHIIISLLYETKVSIYIWTYVQYVRSYIDYETLKTFIRVSLNEPHQMLAENTN